MFSAEVDSLPVNTYLRAWEVMLSGKVRRISIQHRLPIYAILLRRTDELQVSASLKSTLFVHVGSVINCSMQLQTKYAELD